MRAALERLGAPIPLGLAHILGVARVELLRVCALYQQLAYRPLQTEPYLKHGSTRHAGDDCALDMTKLLGLGGYPAV